MDNKNEFDEVNENTQNREEETQTEIDDIISEYTESENTENDNELDDDSIIQGSIAVKTKKKPLLMKTTIISIIIFLIAVASASVYLIFFNVSLVGDYVFVQEEVSGSPTYLIMDNDGKASFKISSVTFIGEYNVTPSGALYVSIPTDQGYFQGEYNFELTGNNISKKTLTLTNETGAVIEFASTTLPDLGLTKPKDFKTDEKLIGKWSISESEYLMEYNFNEDGTMYMLSATQRIDAVYTVKEDKIDVIYKINGQEGTIPIPYYFDKDKLVIGEVGFEKVA